MPKALLSSIFKYCSTTIFCDIASEKQRVNNITRRIPCGDELVSSEDSEIIEDIWVLNFRDNKDGPKLQVFWDAIAWVIKTNTGDVSHIQPRLSRDKETTLFFCMRQQSYLCLNWFRRLIFFLLILTKKVGSRIMCPVFVLGLHAIVALFIKQKKIRKVYSRDYL